jgi:aminopeptidase-like protein/NADP-dependent 3-hydroxy acid dehydrogenase YdfG
MNPIRAMGIAQLRKSLDPMEIARDMYTSISDLYPLCRSITGHGLRETLRRIGHYVPMTIHEIPTGTRAYDWTVPKEWNIRDAYVRNSKGERVIDFKVSNLHVMNYSVPIRQGMSFTDLMPHLFTLPDRPEWIPYRTSYFEEGWGFCLSHSKFLELKDGEYEVCIDSSLEAGHLTYGEGYFPGESTDEVLISCHVCHPSLCNDNLSGVVLAATLAQHLRKLRLRYSYRFLFIPGTIGAITWLWRNERQLSRIKHGLVLTCLGAPGKLTYKKSRQGNAEIDCAATHVLAQHPHGHQILEFSPDGYAERQFCSPAFNLPVGRLMKAPDNGFPEYHTSADNLSFIRASELADSFATCLSILDVLEANRFYINQNPKGEPHFGRRGLGTQMGGTQRADIDDLSMPWVLNLSDGRHTLLDVADRSGCSFDSIKRAAKVLMDHGLLKVAHSSTTRMAPPADGTAGAARNPSHAAPSGAPWLNAPRMAAIPTQSRRELIAVVTGATGAIGSAIALGLAAMGCVLCLTGRKTPALEALAERARAGSPNVLAYATDLTQDGEIQKLSERLQSDFGGVDLLVHAAGVHFAGPHETASVEDLDLQYQVNVRAPYLVTQRLLPMLRLRQGQIVFINSTAGLQARAAVGQYASTKHALRAIAESLRDEVNGDGVRILNLYLGRTASRLQAENFEREGKAYRPELLLQPEDVASMLIAAIGLPRTAEVTEIKIRPLMKSC